METELKDILFVSQKEKKAPVSEMYVFAALLFLQRYPAQGEKVPEGLNDFLRITRNLLGNTPDRTLREWPSMLKALRTMIEAGASVFKPYEVISTLPASSLTGFREEQRQVEILKAKLIIQDPDFKPILDEMDENAYIRGKIGNIAKLLSNRKNVERIAPQAFSVKKLTDFFDAYKAMEKYDNARSFDGVWSELLDTSMYEDNEYRCWYGGGCNEYDTLEIHPALLELVQKCANMNIEDVLVTREKEYVRSMIQKHGNDLGVITEPKAQLYLLYIFTLRVLGNKNWRDFFKKGFNFAWLRKGKGFSTPFVQTGEQKEAVFQTYRAQFHKQDELIENRTPFPNLAGNNKQFSERLANFANWDE